MNKTLYSINRELNEAALKVKVRNGTMIPGLSLALTDPTKFPFRRNNLEGMPRIFKYHNASTDTCDMLVGPCSCGAMHSAEEWVLVRVKP